MKVNYLIICSQNVGRSQMAAGFMKTLLESSEMGKVRSAGIDIQGMKRKYHNRPHPQVIDVMREEGIDISREHIMQLHERQMRKATKIIVLCAENELPEYAKKYSRKLILAEVTDPARPRNGSTPEITRERLCNTRDQIRTIVFDKFMEGGERYGKITK